MTRLRLCGAYTALVTPFTPDGSHLDVAALEAHVARQLDQGISGLVPCGTTGESPTLSDAEMVDVTRRTVSLAKGRVPIIAGAGSNSTAKSIHHARAALDAGADGVMIVMPYYNKPSQDGLFRHVTAIAREVGGAPVVLYNIPGRSVVDLSTDTLARIVDAAPNVVAIKDATGNILRCQQTISKFGDELDVMCGDDALTLGMMAVGARGVISVTSNLMPAQLAAVCKAASEGRWDDARRLHYALLPVHEAMFVEPNPVPVKVALSIRGWMSPAVRLPLSPALDSTRKLVTDVIRQHDARGGK